MAKVIVIGGAVWALVSVLAFLLMNPILAAAVAIFGLVVVVIAVMAQDWERHPDFAAREQVRAEKRAIKREKTQAARDRDRARWEAHEAKKARAKKVQKEQRTPQDGPSSPR